MAWGQDTFYSTGSGDWSDPSRWTTRGQRADEDGFPDADDEVVIQAGHQVTFSAHATAPNASVLHLYGELRLQGDTGARLWTQRILVRPGGLLEAQGPHTLTLAGGVDSLLVVYAQGRLRLQGRQVVEQSQLTAVLRETENALVLEDSLQRWEPGALRGHVLKLLSGRGRLWSFEVVTNTEHTLTLRPGSRGAPPGPRLFVGEADPQRPWLMSVPADTMDTQARPYADRLLRGQWLVRPGVPGATPRYILGALEGEPGQPDQLWVWPPLPEALRQVRWSTSYGLAAGDQYTLYQPAQITIPEARQLPARPQGPTNAQLILNEGSHSVLRHLSLGYTFVTLRGLDVTQGDSSLELDFVDIHHADASCIFTGQGVRGLLLEQLHIRDVHPDNDLEEFGGRWTPDKQRGHGLCLYGSQLVVRDNLISNVNDDMFYFSQAGELLIEGNIAINAGIFHGNSFENFTLFKTQGEAVLRGNLAMGAQAALLLEERDPGSTVLVEDNLLLQENPGTIYRDRGPQGHGPAVLRNNLMMGGAQSAALLSLEGHDNTLEDNLILGASLHGPALARRNVALASLGGQQALVLDPGELDSNLLVRQDGLGGPVIAWRGQREEPSRVTHNTLVGGQGLEIAGAGVARRPQVSVDHNLIQGGLLTGAARDANPGAVNLEVAHNHFSGPRFGRVSWQAPFVESSNQRLSWRWVDEEHFLLDPSDPAALALDGLPVGYQRAGLLDPGALPVALPQLWSQRDPQDPSLEQPQGQPQEQLPSEPDPGELLEPRAYRAQGCACSLPGATPPTPGAWWLLLAPLAWWRRPGT